MTIHDISQNILTARVLHGDTAPTTRLVQDIHDGYRLTDINMCLHNGTHIDAPSHFLADGASIEHTPLQSCIGECIVVRTDSDIDAEFVYSLPECPRILFDGKALIVPSGATALVDRGVVLVGIARMSVANEQYCTAVHQILLGASIVILESIVLKHIAQGSYKLVALPLNIGGCEASPVRAVLIEE